MPPTSGTTIIAAKSHCILVASYPPKSAAAARAAAAIAASGTMPSTKTPATVIERAIAACGSILIGSLDPSRTYITNATRK